MPFAERDDVTSCTNNCQHWGCGGDSRARGGTAHWETGSKEGIKVELCLAKDHRHME